MVDFLTLDNVSTDDIFPNEILKHFHSFSSKWIARFTDEILETQPTVTTASLMLSQIPRTQTLHVELSDELQTATFCSRWKESRFPVVPSKK